MQTEYTTLGSAQGILTIWSDSAAMTPFILRVSNKCQRTSYIFDIDPITRVSTSRAIATPLRESPPAQTSVKISALASAPLNDQELELLEQQISQLQENFGQLQRQLDALYKVNLQQSHIVETRNTELTHIKSENHLLRTLVMCLGFVLLCSSYFFADWLRRHSATPRTTRQTTNPSHKISAQENQAMSERPIAATPAHGKPLVNPASTELPNTPSNISKSSMSRVQPLPRHANDDELSPRKKPGVVTAPDSEEVIKNASHFLTHGRINQAIQHLQNHLAQQPKCSPWVWLYLLDLLGREGKQQEFDLAASECRKYFNINVERNPDSALHGIESFSRITRALQQAWGSPAVVTLIDDLIYNTRLVPRIGFERTVFEDLMLLRAIACITQALPNNQQAPQEQVATDEHQGLRDLQQLSEDIGALSPSDSTAFQYWSDFTFELEEYPKQRKSA
ncbi:type IV pilus assembly protein FimV [Methylophilus aquaticus]|uniref:Tetratricopeptide repeat protein n=1 Tax=Methylophilus aquaticus TaxID=1971610 RepID=A0ABT9JPH6_9PROT|nr:hypothetical protein [Methylophilus aquaticus]MDP8566476.1 hypothetical protein [Methylophilus aquaticus]